MSGLEAGTGEVRAEGAEVIRSESGTRQEAEPIVQLG